jgi:hypothetical protein
MDKIVKNVIDKFKERSARGVAKYGTTLADNNTDDFLTHLQEELMDAVLYIEKLKQPKQEGLPGSIVDYIIDGKYTKCVKIIKNSNNLLFYHYDYIEIIPEQQRHYKIGQKVNYVLIDEFTNPNLFTHKHIYTDKRYAKII